ELLDGMPAVDSVTITGPLQNAGAGDTASRRRIFVCRPIRAADEDLCARRLLSTLARLAYRGQATDPDVETLMRFYKVRSGEKVDARIELALEMLLVSPKFLFRVELDPANADSKMTYRVSDLELASRLAFFLWSSIPDAELLDLAARGQLKDPVVLERQVKRMLADSKADALVENFASQWLLVRNIRDATPDPDVFPEYDDNVGAAFERETQLFLASQLREDRSLIELVSANYTFINERLARHYRVPNVYGNHFRRVTFDADGVRGGLLGQGSL